VTIDRSKLKALVDRGLTLEAIGTEIGVSRQRVKQLVDRLGWVRVDQRVNPDKVIPVPPRFPGGVAAHKRENNLCKTGGCFNPLHTRTLCGMHAERMRVNARAKKTIS